MLHSYNTYPAPISDHKASADRDQHPAGSAAKHIYGAVFFALAPCTPHSDNPIGACGIHRFAEHAIRAHAATTPVTTTTPTTRPTLESTWRVPLT
jgi:hypothetical protein